MSIRRDLGHGIGLRPQHYQDVLGQRPELGFLELISENFMVAGGNPRRVLRAVRDLYRIVLHGVSLSLGSPEPLDENYLEALVRLADDVDAPWVSDHLCWSRLGQHTVHDLWPLPFTEEALDHVAERVRRVQDRLGRPFLVENVSSYLEFRGADMTEWEMLTELVRRTGCGLLLDVNNVYVSAYNHRFEPLDFIRGIPPDAVGQIHLAGHSDHGTHLLDTHDHPVADAVWALYRETVRRVGNVPTLIEWDDQIPPLARVVEESRRARAVETEALREGDVRASVA